MSFSQLRISSDILKGLKDVKIDTPSPLQKKVANAMKTGGDLLVQTSGESQPETGYLVPILDHIARQDRRQGTKAILLTQQAEHAAEIETWIQTAGKHAGIESLAITESGDGEKQRNGLSAGPSIIIATPAWFAELLEENRMIFREAKYLVLDGASNITEWDAVDAINKRIIGNCQRIATVSHPEEELPKELLSFLNEPETVTSKPKKSAPAPENLSIPKQLTQYYIKVPPRRKISTLIALLEGEGEDQVLIFTASRRTADRLYRILKKNNLQAVSLGKDLDEETFADRIKRFADQEARYLIAGELSAADLPLDTISKIINYDVPEEVGEYKLRADLTRNEKGTRIV
ncbi:MAG: DEAD/DEAH box helicase, partial [Balneolaceae bacterium]